VPSRFINKAALMTTNCFGAVERRFQFRRINRRSQHVLSYSSFHLSGLTGFNRRHKVNPDGGRLGGVLLCTETKKHSPNTGAHANYTLHK